MGEGAGPAIFGVRLPHAMPQRDAPVRLPDFFARADLNRDQHEVGAGQQLAALGRAADAQLGVPGAVHNLGQLVDDAQALGVDVAKREPGAAHGRVLDDGG